MRHSAATFALLSVVLVQARPWSWWDNIEPVTVKLPATTATPAVDVGEVPAVDLDDVPAVDFSGEVPPVDIDDVPAVDFSGETFADLDATDFSGTTATSIVDATDSSETTSTSTVDDSSESASTTVSTSATTSATSAYDDGDGEEDYAEYDEDSERHGSHSEHSASAASSSPTTTIGAPATTESPPPILKPEGGQGFNTTPVYHAQSDFDTASLYLGLHQELIELDLFRFALASFTDEQFVEAGLGADDRALLAFIAEQEVGHAQLISSMIDVDTESPRQCTYTYPPFATVRDFIDFARLVTRYGEGGTIGFLAHLDAQAAAALVNDAIQTEGRQQMVFRQWEGLSAMPFWFSTSITQGMQWTLLAPYIATCPETTPRVEWTAFPALSIVNNPSLLELNQTAAVSSNETDVAPTATDVLFTWDAPGAATGWNASYTTKSLATGAPLFAAFINQLNTTYVWLRDVDLEARTARAYQPGGGVMGDGTAPLFNGTVYVVITDLDVPVTPYNLSQIESHIIAGPALYNVG